MGSKTNTSDREHRKQGFTVPHVFVILIGLVLCTIDIWYI